MNDRIYIWHERNEDVAFNDVPDDEPDDYNPDGYDWDEEEPADD